MIGNQPSLPVIASPKLFVLSRQSCSRRKLFFSAGIVPHGHSNSANQTACRECQSAECRVQKEQKEHATRNSFCAKENANENANERWSFAKNSPKNSPPMRPQHFAARWLACTCTVPVQVLCGKLPTCLTLLFFLSEELVSGVALEGVKVSRGGGGLVFRRHGTPLIERRRQPW